jgi:CheY-like chemotaxis protein
LAKEPEQALIWINRVLDLDPQHPQARRALTRVRLQAAMAVAWGGDFTTARQLLHQAADDEPSSILPWLELAAIAGSADEARSCLSEVIHRDPHHAGARQCLAHLDRQERAATALPARLAALKRTRGPSAHDMLIPVNFEVPADLDKTEQAPVPPLAPRMRVMIIDDTQSVRELVRRHIEAMGFQALEAQGAKEAVATLQLEGVPDLILLDGIMPGVNGFDLCNQLRQQEETSRVPIVLLAFENGWLPSLRSMMSGFSETLAKPIVPTTLRAMIAKYCQPETVNGSKPSSEIALAEGMMR